ncbi:hypothetical protein [Clostridium sartagoforme]|nr:hypothetical protein [Clostridium sartagoforme]
MNVQIPIYRGITVTTLIKYAEKRLDSYVFSIKNDDINQCK